MPAHLLEFLVGGLLTVLLGTALVIGTWAALRTGSTSQTIRNFRDNAESWELKSKAKDGEIADLQAGLATAQEALAKATGKVRDMEDMVSGTKAVEALRTEMLEQFRQTRKLIGGAG